MVKLELKHRLCFPFCSDLGNKKIYEAPKGLDDQINIKWSLFRVKQHYNLMGGGGVELPNSDIIVPGSYTIEKIKSDWSSGWNDKEYAIFVAPSDYYQDGKIFYDTKREITIDLPKEINEYPHLHKHSTFQFSYLMDNLFTCSCQFLDCQDGKIKINIWVSASPSGTYLIWKSGTIFFKWKIEIRQNIVVMNLVKEELERLWNSTKKAGTKFIQVASGGTINLNEDDTKAMLEKKLLEGNKDAWSKLGLDKERTGKVQEQHTERMFKSTYIDMVDRTIEPTIFYSNSIQFPYNLFDYGLRAVFKPYWQYRIYVGENLLNNLIHNNNVNPITYPLDITFSKLGNILKKGYYQGKLTLDYDPGGNMAKCFARGVTFYEDKEKDFPNPNLGVKEIDDQIGLTGFAGSYYTAQTIVEPGEGITVNIPYTADQRGYGHSTYIKLTNSSVMDNFKNSLSSRSKKMIVFCWGVKTWLWKDKLYIFLFVKI